MLLLAQFAVRPLSVPRTECLLTKLVQVKEEIPEMGMKPVAEVKVKAKAHLAVQMVYHQSEGIGVSCEYLYHHPHN